MKWPGPTVCELIGHTLLKYVFSVQKTILSCNIYSKYIMPEAVIPYLAISVIFRSNVCNRTQKWHEYHTCSHSLQQEVFYVNFLFREITREHNSTKKLFWRKYWNMRNQIPFTQQEIYLHFPNGSYFYDYVRMGLPKSSSNILLTEKGENSIILEGLRQFSCM